MVVLSPAPTVTGLPSPSVKDTLPSETDKLALNPPPAPRLVTVILNCVPRMAAVPTGVITDIEEPLLSFRTSPRIAPFLRLSSVMELVGSILASAKL